MLEQQLEEADQAEKCPLFLAKNRSDANPTRQALLGEIESRLADYGTRQRVEACSKRKILTISR